MGTRCRIGLIHDDCEQVYVIHVMLDGYPQHTGKRLLENYDTLIKVEKLLELGVGGLYQLGAELGEKHDFRNMQWDANGRRVEQPDWCDAYFRDTGETVEEPYVGPLEEGEWSQYNYLFTPAGQWLWFEDDAVETARPLLPSDCISGGAGGTLKWIAETGKIERVRCNSRAE